MNIDKQSNSPVASEVSRVGKRAYIKPAFRHETVFEVMALACGKIRNTQASCRSSRRSS